MTTTHPQIAALIDNAIADEADESVLADRLIEQRGDYIPALAHAAQAASDALMLAIDAGSTGDVTTTATDEAVTHATTLIAQARKGGPDPIELFILSLSETCVHTLRALIDIARSATAAHREAAGDEAAPTP